jgi:hypothetical protein
MWGYHLLEFVITLRNPKEPSVLFTTSSHFLHLPFTITCYNLSARSVKENLVQIGKVTKMNKTKLNFLLDTAIFIAFLLSAVSGVVFLFLPQGGFQGGRNPGFQGSILFLSRAGWRDLHTWASLIFVAGVVIHLALHWRWIVCVAKRYARNALGHSRGREKGTCPLQA